MSYRERHVRQFPERVHLDNIRRELGMLPEVRRNPCPICGAEREPQQRPVQPCWLCGDQRVRAANLLRAIHELASPTEGGFYHAYPVDTQRAHG